MANYPTETIVACGGGVVETPDARKELHKWMNRFGFVIHIKRNIEDLVAFLQKDKTRPAYVDDSVAVWNRRKDFYRECSNFEYTIPQKRDDLYQSEHEYWSQVEKGFASRVQFSLFGTVEESSHRSLDTSFFLSLTFPDVSQARSIIQTITAGVDAVELRVDMLQSTDEDFVAEQLTILRQLTDLPVIFTVRTKAQGGRFSDTDFEGMLRLTESALRWGCEYVDVEVTTLITSHKSRLEEILSRKRNSKIIASFHDLKGEMTWTSLENSEEATKKKEMKEVYSLLHAWGDIIKLIGQAKTLRDNFDLEWFMERDVQSLGMTPVKPLIALNMGRIGQISRVLNQFMTPVTHPALPSAAAPGQLSVAEIHSVRYKLGLLPKWQFFLFGSPISQSMSPTLQNTGFAELGLPHDFGLFESTDVEAVRSLIQEKLRQGEFGGAAVTIPLKEDIIKYKLVSRVTPSAEKIGAINTLMLDKDNATLVGDNTDWLGIKACIERHSLCIQPRIGVVLGAGGTARAACFALQQMGVQEIRIWNRTIERAQTLAQEFGCRVVQQLDSLLSSESSETEFWIVSTIPASAQSGMAELPQLFSNPQARGVIVDMAYRPKVTPLLALVKSNTNWKVSYGIDALIEQGLEQFERWTGRRAPRQVMEDQVLSRYEASS
jgi:pentafunctional AROM polypeptide